MSRNRMVFLSGILLVVGAAGLFAGCSKDKSTNPPAAKELGSGQLAQNESYPHTVTSD